MLPYNHLKAAKVIDLEAQGISCNCSCHPIKSYLKDASCRMDLARDPIDIVRDSATAACAASAQSLQGETLICLMRSSVLWASCQQHLASISGLNSTGDSNLCHDLHIQHSHAQVCQP